MKKRGIAITLVCALVFCLAGTLPTVRAAETILPMGGEGDGPERYQTTEQSDLGVSFEIRDAKLTGVVIPSWYAGAVSAKLLLYRWDTDYRTTVEKSPIFTDIIEHPDNPATSWIDPGMHDFRVDFGRAFSEGRYLLVYRAYLGTALYVPVKSEVEGITCYIDGDVYERQSGDSTVRPSFLFSCILDPAAAADDTPNLRVPYAESIIPMYGSGAANDGSSYISVKDYDTVAQKFTVRENYMSGLVINDLFVESGEAKITVNVYAWNQNYDRTISGKPLISEQWNCAHADYYKAYTVFYEKGLPKGDYLITLQTADALNLWTHGPREDGATYLDGAATADFTVKLSYIQDATVAEYVPPADTDVNTETGDPIGVGAVYSILLFLFVFMTYRKVCRPVGNRK